MGWIVSSNVGLNVISLHNFAFLNHKAKLNIFKVTTRLRKTKSKFYMGTILVQLWFQSFGYIIYFIKAQ
jgi:hypothetical protein